MTIPLRVLTVAFVTLPLFAQWPEVKTKRVPLTRDGKPNLNAPAPKLGKVLDFSGVWSAEKTPCVDTHFCEEVDTFGGFPLGVIDASATKPEELATGVKGGLPYTPWAKEITQQRQPKDDPVTRCLPLPAIGHWWTFHPQRVIQTETSLTLLNEYMGQYRQIFLDGRPLPKDPFPTFKGYSVGHWEGDTLVVETIGYKDDVWLDAKGNPLTEAARTIERIRRPNFGTLEIQITINDPKAYTKPWTVTRHQTIALDTELIDYICNENEKDRTHLVGQ